MAHQVERHRQHGGRNLVQVELTLLPLYYQEVRGVSPLTAGIMLVPQGVGALLSRGLAGLTDKIGARPVAVTGFLIVAASTVPFALAGPHTSAWLLALCLVIRGSASARSLSP